MPSYKHFHCQIWGDKKFKKLSADAKLLFIYLFTNERVTLTGIYEPDLDIARIHCAVKDFDKVFQEVIDSTNIKWDNENEVIWIVNRFKYIPTRSPKVLVGVAEELNKINHPFVKLFIEKYKEVLAGYIFRIKGHEEDSDLLSDENVKNLGKIYPNKAGVKKFLERRGIGVEKIDEVIGRVLYGKD